MNSSEPARTGSGSPGDVFRHLLAIVTLYLSAASFGTVVFSFIDRWFPDVLVSPVGVNAGPLRWALSALVIVFPTYVWVSWANARAAVRNPALRSLRSRRWLYHFTVFAAAVVIIGDLIVLIYNFLSGDLTGRFVLKVATVLVIAIIVFAYYLWNIRRETMASADPRMRLLVLGAVAIVAASAIGGFILAGSPFAERARRFDDRRVGDLQTIQWQIINYWQRKDRLPPTLGDLKDPISGFIPPRNPETGNTYEYRSLGNLKFELCADFKTESQSPAAAPAAPRSVAVPPKSPETDTWSHGSGRACFERTIDPDFYRIEKPNR